jgi:DtxR family transcriptional regulator, Mn-dependent transcriptional regulator
MLKFKIKLTLILNNISKEDYLSAIYKFRDKNGQIKANLIAEKLQVSNAAVSDMLKKLSHDGHVKYEPYKGIKLTQNGEEYAKKMVRRHRIWEVFLHQIVGLKWDEVHDEAHKLEHSTSDRLLNKMEEMLDFPEFDPHGDPIPSKDGSLPQQKKTVPLTILKEGQTGKVIRVNDFDNDFLKYISKIGIKLNKEIAVKDVLDFDRSMLVSVERKEINISNTIAANIFVELKN